MEWEQGTVEKAFSLYVALEKKGYVENKDGDFIRWYDERDVQDLVRKVIEPNGKVMIFKDEERKVLQMIPEVENDVHSYTNEDLRRELRFQDNKEVHLFYYILFILISELGQTQDRDHARRLYIPLEELLEKMNQYIDIYTELGEEKLELLTDKYGVDVVGIVDAWNRMAEFKEGAIDQSRTKENHRMYIERTVKFLEKHKLIKVRGIADIAITNIMETIITHYYH